MYFIFIICVVLLLVYSYRTANSDILNPACILCGFIVLAQMLAFSLYDYWDLANYGAQTVLVFIIGIFSFVVGCLMATRTNMHRYAFHLNRKSFSGIVRISNFSYFFFHTILLLSLLLFYMYYRSHVSDFSAEMFAEYKEFRTEEDQGIPAYVNICYKYIQMMAHLDMFIFINNMFYKKSVFILKFLLSPIFFSLVAILNANRGDLLMFVMASFACWYILYLRIRGFSDTLSKKVLKYGGICGGAFLLLFWGLVFIFQADNDIAQASAQMYITCYISGPIGSFDLYLKQGGLPCKWFGQETFVALNNNLSALFDLPYKSQRYLEFRNTGAYSVVNIYSVFRRLFHDFGYAGMIFFSFFQGWFTTKFYKYVVTKRYHTNVDFSLCIYCFFFFTIIYAWIEDFFYSSNFSISGIVKVVMLYVLYKLYFTGSKVFLKKPKV
jgi:oligosaccharide repeat unit polymerase